MDDNNIHELFGQGPDDVTVESPDLPFEIDEVEDAFDPLFDPMKGLGPAQQAQINLAGEILADRERTRKVVAAAIVLLNSLKPNTATWRILADVVLEAGLVFHATAHLDRETRILRTEDITEAYEFAASGTEPGTVASLRGDELIALREVEL